MVVVQRSATQDTSNAQLCSVLPVPFRTVPSAMRMVWAIRQSSFWSLLAGYFLYLSGDFFLTIFALFFLPSKSELEVQDEGQGLVSSCPG